MICDFGFYLRCGRLIQVKITMTDKHGTAKGWL